MITVKEKEIIRALTHEYMDIATLPIQQEKIELWKALNRSEMQRPMVCIDQLPWNELNADGSLSPQIRDPFWANLESHLRRTIYMWNHFPVDMVIDPFIPIQMAVKNTGYGLVRDAQLLGETAEGAVVSHHYKNLLECEDDVNKIKDMLITHDVAESNLRMESAKQIIGDIAPLQFSGMGFHLGIWDTISEYMGVENAYFDMLDRPEFIHSILDKMTNSVIAGIEQANELKIVDTNINTCHCSYVYDDNLLTNSGLGKEYVSQNAWAFGLAQLLTSTSPDITKEFEIPYITKMAKHFGSIYYGCCDRLDDRLDLIKEIPNVRKVSCSPWSIKERFAEKIGSTLIMSNKPNPAFLATSTLDDDVIRKDLKNTCKVAKENNVNLEIILKDISTVKNNPRRLTEWAKIAMDIVQS